MEATTARSYEPVRLKSSYIDSSGQPFEINFKGYSYVHSGTASWDLRDILDRLKGDQTNAWTPKLFIKAHKTRISNFLDSFGVSFNDCFIPSCASFAFKNPGVEVNSPLIRQEQTVTTAGFIHWMVEFCINRKAVLG